MDNFKIVKMESEQHFVKRYDDLIKSYLTFGAWADDAKGKFYEIRNILTELQFSQYQINNFRFKYFANESKSLEIVQAFEIDRIVNGLEHIAEMLDQFFFDTIFDLEHEGIPYNEDIITENIAIEVRKIFHEELKAESIEEMPKETALDFHGKIITALRCIYLNMDAYLYGCKVHYDYKILDHGDSHLFTIPELFNEIHDNIFCIMECYENVLSILYNYGYNVYIDEHVEEWNNPKDEEMIEENKIEPDSTELKVKEITEDNK